jgi:hypothetical protein
MYMHHIKDVLGSDQSHDYLYLHTQRKDLFQLWIRHIIHLKDSLLHHLMSYNSMERLVVNGVVGEKNIQEKSDAC